MRFERPERAALRFAEPLSESPNVEFICEVEFWKLRRSETLLDNLLAGVVQLADLKDM